jgi:hypothetical protein
VTQTSEQTIRVERGPFTQLPQALWTFPGLEPLERWLCATIKRLCWRPGPRLLSYREIAQESGISIGSLGPKKGKTKQAEGMIPKLERLGIIKTYRPVDAEGNPKKGRPILIEPTDKLWKLNVDESQSVYLVNSPVYLVNAGVYSVNESVYHVNTLEGVTQGQERVEQPPKIEDIEDKNTLVANEQQEQHSFVTLARDGGVSFLSNEVSDSQWLSEEREGGEIDAGKVQGIGEGGETDGQPPASIPVEGAAAVSQGVVHTEQSTTTNVHVQPTELLRVPRLTLPSIVKTQENGKYKKEEKPLLCETAPVHVMLNSFRGWVARADGEIKNENNVIYELCTLYPLAHFQATFSYLKTSQSETAKWWRAHHHKLRVKNLHNLLSEILAELGLTPKPEEPPGMTPTPIIHPKWTPNYDIAPRAALAAQ